MRLRDSKGTFRYSFLLISALFGLLLSFGGCEQKRKISVESKPENANVYLDGKFEGRTPLDLEIKPTARTIRVEFENATAISGPVSPSLMISRPLTAAYLPITANLPLFVALDKGYFEQNGLKVNAVEATSPNDIVTGIVSGKIDFAAVLAYPILFPAALRFPGAFKLFSSTEETAQAYTSSIVVAKDSSIKSYQDLRGKSIGVYTGLVQVNFLKAILAGMRIDQKEVKIVEISPRLQIQGLLSGEYDVLSSTEPTTNIAKIQGFARVVVENPRVKYIMCPFPSTATTISTKLINEHPDAVIAVVKALDMAIDFIKASPIEAKKSLLKYTPVPNNIADAVLADLKLFKYCKLGEENRLNVQRFADFLYTNGIIKERIKDVNLLFGNYEDICNR